MSWTSSYAVPAVIMTGAIFMAVVVVRRSLDMSRAWNSGLIAEARCLRCVHDDQWRRR